MWDQVTEKSEKPKPGITIVDYCIIFITIVFVFIVATHKNEHPGCHEFGLKAKSAVFDYSDKKMTIQCE